LRATGPNEISLATVIFRIEPVMIDGDKAMVTGDHEAGLSASGTSTPPSTRPVMLRPGVEAAT
jgi:hypothetical protein